MHENRLGETVSVFKASRFKYVPSRPIMFISSYDFFSHYCELLTDNDIVILDEFQERTIEQDLIFSLLRHQIEKQGRRLKLIVNILDCYQTSLEVFLKNYKFVFVREMVYRVKINYMIQSSFSQIEVTFEQILKEIDAIETKRMAKYKLSEAESNKSRQKNFQGNIIVFFPSYRILIESQKKLLTYVEGLKEKNQSTSEVHVISLIEKSEIKQLLKILRRLKSTPNNRVIILTMKHFQTTFTIPNLKYVVDYGLVKKKKIDKETLSYYYNIGNITKQMAVQRMGRLGRESKGYCFRVYDKRTFDNFSETPKPEFHYNYLDMNLFFFATLMAKINGRIAGADDSQNIYYLIDRDLNKESVIFDVEPYQLEYIKSRIVDLHFVDEQWRTDIEFIRKFIRLNFIQIEMVLEGIKNGIETEMICLCAYPKVLKPLIIFESAQQFYDKKVELFKNYRKDKTDDVHTILAICRDLMHPNYQIAESLCRNLSITEGGFNRFRNLFRILLSQFTSRREPTFEMDLPTLTRKLKAVLIKIFYRNMTIKIPSNSHYYQIARKQIVTFSDDSIFYFKGFLDKLETFIYLNSMKYHSMFLSCDTTLRLDNDDILQITDQPFLERVQNKRECPSWMILNGVSNAVEIEFMAAIIVFQHLLKKSDIFVLGCRQNTLKYIDFRDDSSQEVFIQQILRDIKTRVSREIIYEPIDDQFALVLKEGFRITDVLGVGEFALVSLFNFPRDKKEVVSQIFGLDVPLSKGETGSCNYYIEWFNNTKNLDSKFISGRILFDSKELASRAYIYAKNYMKECQTSPDPLRMTLRDVEIKPKIFNSKAVTCKLEIKWFKSRGKGTAELHFESKPHLEQAFDALQAWIDSTQSLMNISKHITNKSRQLLAFDVPVNMTEKDFKRIIHEKCPILKGEFRVKVCREAFVNKSNKFWKAQLVTVLKKSVPLDKITDIVISNKDHSESCHATVKVFKPFEQKIILFFEMNPTEIGFQKAYAKITGSLCYKITKRQYKHIRHTLQNIRTSLIQVASANRKSIQNDHARRRFERKVFEIPPEEVIDHKSSLEKIYIHFNLKYFEGRDIRTYLNQLEDVLHGHSVSISQELADASHARLREVELSLNKFFKSEYFISLKKIKGEYQVYGIDSKAIAYKMQELIDEINNNELFIKLENEEYDLLIREQGKQLRALHFLLNQNSRIEIDCLNERTSAKLHIKGSLDDKKEICQTINKFISMISNKPQTGGQDIRCKACPLATRLVKFSNCPHTFCHFCLREHIQRSLGQSQTFLETGVVCSICKTPLALKDLNLLFNKNYLVNYLVRIKPDIFRMYDSRIKNSPVANQNSQTGSLIVQTKEISQHSYKLDNHSDKNHNGFTTTQNQIANFADSNQKSNSIVFQKIANHENSEPSPPLGIKLEKKDILMQANPQSIKNSDKDKSNAMAQQKINPRTDAFQVEEVALFQTDISVIQMSPWMSSFKEFANSIDHISFLDTSRPILSQASSLRPRPKINQSNNRDSAKFSHVADPRPKENWSVPNRFLTHIPCPTCLFTDKFYQALQSPSTIICYNCLSFCCVDCKCVFDTKVEISKHKCLSLTENN